MRKIKFLTLTASLFLLGCGEKDLNKDLKPVGKDAPKPSAAGAPAAPGKSDGKQSNSVAPTTPQ
ncbi:hypothetical protein KIH39_01605 [Telmatocola sphagniphila]|uniref:Lipoprotein n=1 Tax=Telmatocola sphagniphila TaxID=1123043 RepID=A0A8E6B690_9BACT|nr:hypothetical protein [Telmatocola sphagniphila]QVL32638.1 hypothetical protein KIH39_01605 [Telmatocola sphagniphila]